MKFKSYVKCLWTLTLVLILAPVSIVLVDGIDGVGSGNMRIAVTVLLAMSASLCTNAIVQTVRVVRRRTSLSMDVLAQQK
ncbi:MAG: hypothetical protein LBS92_07310 [Candidatus Methanoplasma sp.]|nr:hypothetical protein [Candidatus Methanoplasma sp.]